MTACTFLDHKWPHLAHDGEVLLRASLGRIDDTRALGWSDAEVVERAWEELGALMGVHGQPNEAAVVRYVGALPQYRVHHLLAPGGIRGGAGPARRHRGGRSGVPRSPASPPAARAAGATARALL